MDRIVSQLPVFIDKISKIKEIILSNLLLIGQVPSPTFREKRRTAVFLERLSEAQVDECTTDGYGNPIGIVRGSDSSRPQIHAIAHLDTFFSREVDHHYTVREETIMGAGVMDNSLGVAILASMPEILKAVGLQFKSDLVLAGVIQSLARGNLRGIRHLLKNWESPICGAVVIEGGEIGRLNYYSEGMMRCEVSCHIEAEGGWQQRFKPNAILVIYEVINQILRLRLPQRPRSRVIIGKVAGGHKHGIIAYDASLGFEIQSDSERMVKSIYADIQDLVTGIGHEHEVKMVLKTISNSTASRLRYNHPLVKGVDAIMRALEITPVGEPSASELSILLSHRIPAVTLGITHGDNYHQPNATMLIAPMFKGIAQVVATLLAIDEGVCNEK